MSSPLVSIVIPCYNAEAWIAESVESALAQTWGQLEVIVVDDGSTDRSADIVRGYGDRIRLDTGPNRGGCAARNRGIELARGEWIQFLDADDRLLPDCVRTKVEAKVNSDEVPCCRVRKLEPSEGRIPTHWLRTEFRFVDLIEHGSPQTAAPLHHREHLLAVGGFREGLPCAQEHDLHLRLAVELGLKFVSLDAVGVEIRAAAGSVSRKAKHRMQLAIADVLLTCARQMRERGKRDSRCDDIIAQRCIGLARKLWRMGFRAEALSIAARARAVSPNWHRRSYKSPIAGAIAWLGGFENFERMHDGWRRVTRARIDPTERH